MQWQEYLKQTIRWYATTDLRRCWKSFERALKPHAGDEDEEQLQPVNSRQTKQASVRTCVRRNRRRTAVALGLNLEVLVVQERHWCGSDRCTKFS